MAVGPTQVAGKKRYRDFIPAGTSSTRPGSTTFANFVDFEVIGDGSLASGSLVCNFTGESTIDSVSTDVKTKRCVGRPTRTMTERNVTPKR